MMQYDIEKGKASCQNLRNSLFSEKNDASGQEETFGKKFFQNKEAQVHITKSNNYNFAIKCKIISSSLEYLPEIREKMRIAIARERYRLAKKLGREK